MRFLTTFGSIVLVGCTAVAAHAADTETWLETTAAFWYDATDIDADGIADTLASGTAVTQWYDRSINGRTAVQSDANKQPTIATSSELLNSLNTVVFDGSAGLDTQFNLPAGEKTLFLVMTGTGITAGNAQNWGTQRFYAGLRTSNQRSWLGAGTVIVESPDTPVGTSGSDWHISVSSDTGASRATQTFDGDLVADEALTTSTAGANTFRLGDVLSGGNELHGNIAEAIMFTSSLTAAEEQEVAQYLEQKWGLQGTLREGTNVVANFADNGDLDGPSAGWSDGWAATTSSAVITTGPKIASANPLQSGGNYLTATFTTPATHAAGNFDGTVGRELRSDDTTDDVDISKQHRVEFDFRTDEIVGDFSSSGGDFINVFASNSKTTVGASTASWLIRALGGQPNWFFFHGDGSGDYANGTFLDSGIAFEEGVDYHFVVDVDPTNALWDVTVTGYFDTGEQTATLADLGFRKFDTSGETWYWDTLNFGGRLGSAEDAEESFTISLDTLEVSAIPEPSTLVLLALAALGLALHGRRRHRRQS